MTRDREEVFRVTAKLSYESADALYRWLFEQGYTVEASSSNKVWTIVAFRDAGWDTQAVVGPRVHSFGAL